MSSYISSYMKMLGSFATASVTYFEILSVIILGNIINQIIIHFASLIIKPMNILSQNVSKAIQKYLYTNDLEADISTLNSDTLIYSSSNVYLLIKTMKGQKVELKLLIVDLKKITQQYNSISEKDVRCVNLALFTDNQVTTLSSKYRESRIELQINPIDKSYWLLTLQTPAKEGAKTQIFLGKLSVEDKEDIPIDLPFYSVNTSSSDISKVKFHPESSDYFVILYRRPKIDFVNFLKNMSYPQIQIDLSLYFKIQEEFKFVDVEFGRDVEDIFNVYILTDGGDIYYLPRILLNQSKIQEVRSVQLKNSAVWKELKDNAKIANNRIEISIDQANLLANLRPIVISKTPNQNPINAKYSKQYLQFRYFKSSRVKAFVLLYTIDHEDHIGFYCQLTVVPISQKIIQKSRNLFGMFAYPIQNMFFKHYYSFLFINSIKFNLPKFIEQTHSSEYVNILYLNSIYQLQLTNLFKFMNQKNPSKQQLLIYGDQPIISYQALINNNRLVGTIEPQKCGFYGVSLIEDFVLLIHSDARQKVRFSAFSLTSKADESRIQMLKKEFEALQIKYNIQDEKLESSESNEQQESSEQSEQSEQEQGQNNNELLLNIDQEIQTIYDNHYQRIDEIKRQILKRHTNILSLTTQYNSKCDSTYDDRKGNLKARLQNVKTRLNQLVKGKPKSKSARSLVNSEKFKQMSDQFSLGKKLIKEALVELEKSTQADVKEFGKEIQANWKQSGEMLERMRKINEIMEEIERE